MTAQIAAAAPMVDAFRLPPQALLAQRIPKKLLAEQGAATAADRRLVADAVEELVWHAALKPATVGLPPGDHAIELALVCVALRTGVAAAQAGRVRQLIHRAIPYPVLLVATDDGGTMLSLAAKRSSLADAGKWVVDSPAQTHGFDPAHPTATEATFLASLALDGLPRGVLTDLGTVYQGYADRITALAAAQVSGQFAVAADAAGQRESLAERERALRQLAAARGKAAGERQMARRVRLNLQIQQLQGRLRVIEETLGVRAQATEQ